MWNLEASVSCKCRGGSGLGVGGSRTEQRSRGVGSRRQCCEMQGRTDGVGGVHHQEDGSWSQEGRKREEGGERRAAKVGGEDKRQGKGGPKVPGRDRAVRGSARPASGTLGQGGVLGNSIPK